MAIAEDRAGAIHRDHGLRLRHAGKRYSRFVGLMKIVLPSVAAVLVALVVAWPQFQDVRQGFRIEIAKLQLPLAGGQRVANARFTGVDRMNRPFTVTAETAVQAEDKPGIVDLARPKADITLADGAWVAASARQGLYMKQEQVLHLDGEVDLFHDTGFELHTPRAVVDLANGTASGDDPVNGHGPSGTLNATGFRIMDGGKRILFLGKAKLVLHPEAGRG
jgi:lipopolysaccharide export system protein LptC